MMRSVMIGLDIHKLIEAERRSFEEDDNTVLRRLLSLPEKDETDAITSPVAVNRVDARGSWRGEGIELPHGTCLFMSYGRGSQEIFGRIENGEWVVNGRHYSTPSGAASGSARKADGTTPILGGYKYWHVLLPGARDWVSLQSLRAGTPSISIGISMPPWPLGA